jgi:protein-S-isoprenylcysteine O-methyltransferase Ste14
MIRACQDSMDENDSAWNSKGRVMRRIAAILGSIVFFFIAPFTVAGVVPWLITDWHVRLPEFANPISQGIGAAMAAVGAFFLIDSFARFALKGLGTPAPVFPTKHLVVDGLYRHVRNPMYIGVVAAILGQAMIFASPGLLIYAALIWLAFNIFVAAYEEPTLRETFGAEYEEFCRNVRRWIPRLTPWRGSATGRDPESAASP